MNFPYVHYCPHCHAMLSVNRLPVEKTASKCPTCQKYVILKDYGEVMLKPKVYTCPKCKETHIYEDRPPMVFCDKCNTLFITSEQGLSLIEPDLLSKGDKGELPYIKKKDRVVALRNKWRFLPTKHKVATFAGIAVVIISIITAYILSLPAAIETTKAYAAMDSIWAEFREKNPYNIQIEGIKAFDDNSYVVLLTEPSTNVDSTQLHDFFKKYNCAFKTNKTKIGYDGWLKDAIVCFNDIKPDKIQGLADKLSTLLYGTDYKASFLDLDVIPRHTEYSEFDLNESVSEEELRQWFIEDKEKLVCASDATTERILAELLSDKQTNDVFYSKQPGFVVWIINKGYCEEESFRVCARKFALDSDLIFGAISNEKNVAIIARERCVPIYELPPMRVETLCLLAGTTKAELAQSYERNSLFAGKLPGGKDYAPIYLSDELWHTEYGSMLNITDQMLKSWSENGNIDYVDFNYTKPVNWTFEKGAMKDLDVSELTYNWNTAGTGYIVEDDQYCIYALNRTGSLPISYIPGDTDGIEENDKVYQAEQKAYDFFSYLSCPELVKVVQYVAMYQIFTNLGISIYNNSDIETVQVIPEEYLTDAEDLLNKIANFDITEKKRIAKLSNAQINEDGKGLELGSGLFLQSNNTDLPTNDFLIDLYWYFCDSTDTYYDDLFKLEICQSVICKLEPIHQALDAVKDDKTFMSSLAGHLIDRNIDVEYQTGSGIYNTDEFAQRHEENIAKAYELVLTNTDGIKLYHQKFIKNDLNYYKDLLVESNTEGYKEWIKCPTIVLSWSLTDSTSATGGHNLDSKVTRFKVTKDAKVGKPIERNGKIEISARDRAAHISDQSYLRRVGRLNDVTIKGENVVAVRARENVVGIAKSRSARGFNTADHSKFIVKAEGDGYRIGNGKKITDVTTLFDAISKQKISGSEGEVIRIELEGFNSAGVDVDVFIKGMHARMRKGGCSAIPVEKYDFAHYTSKVDGDKAFVTIPIKAGDLQFGSTSNVIQAGFGGSTTTTPKISIAKGEVVFSMPKSKMQTFISALKEFFSSCKGFMNERLLKQILRKYGVNPHDCGQDIILDIRANNEMEHLKIALIQKRDKRYYVSDIQEISIA